MVDDLTVVDAFAHGGHQDVAGWGFVGKFQCLAEMAAVVAGRVDGNGLVVEDALCLEVIEPAVGRVLNLCKAELRPAVGIEPVKNFLASGGLSGINFAID